MTDAQLSARNLVQQGRDIYEFSKIPAPKRPQFHEAEANAQFPEGCKCGNNGGGDCDWCQVYYGWSEAPEPQDLTDRVVQVWQRHCDYFSQRLNVQAYHNWLNRG